MIQPKTASLNANLNADKITTNLTNPVSIELLHETVNSSNVIKEVKEERREDRSLSITVHPTSSPAKPHEPSIK